MPPAGLEGRVAVVTGGARGIGEATASRLARDGARVAILDLDGEAAERTAASLRDTGAEAIGLGTDVADLDAVQAAFSEVDRRLGPVSRLVNNAGWDRITRFVDSGPDLWDRVIAVNYRGVLAVTHEALARMAPAKDGRIVSVASDAGRVGSSGEAVYSGAKAAVIAFSKALAREVARDGILLNCVCPGPTDTALLDDIRRGEGGEKIVAGLERAIPLRRLGKPEDVAGVVAFLLSDDAGYVTGQTISVSGGLTMAG